MRKLSFLLFFLATSFGFSQAPTVDSPTPPVRNAVDVISIFSDAYNNITGANYNPDWQQSGFSSASSSFEPTGPGNVVLAYPNFNYQGIEFNAVLDITAMEFLHLDIWTVDGVVPNITVISSGAEIPHAIPNGDGAWQSIDIPVPGITGDLTSAIQFKFAGGNGSTNAIYVDNLYFWKTAAAPGKDASLSALAVDGVPIAGFTPNSASYSLELPGGTTVVPQITLATTSDPAASAAITQATSIPGNATVLVTSQDGTTTQTYTVSYYIGAPNTDAPTPPTRNAVDVISIFSDAYNNITGANYNPDWQQSGFSSASTSFEPTGAGGSGDVVLAYPNFNYQGIEFNSVLDITAMEFLHLDIWTVDGVVSNITVISSGAEIPHAIPNGDGAWQSIDIPVPGITGDLTGAIQIKFAGGIGSTNAIYVDNLYFWKTAVVPGKDASLSALAVDGTGIVGFTPNSASYSLELPGGTTVVPQVTLATTSDPAASAAITQATAIPGDATVLVTSQDGTTTQTYTVSYYIGAPNTDAPTPPARNTVDVISIFSDAYSNITGANYNPDWQQSGLSSASSSFEPTGAGGSGNVVLAYPNFNYQGIEFNTVLDITAMDFLHLDIWTVDGVSPNITVLSSGAEIPHAIQNGDGAWQSVDIAVPGITGDLSGAIQIKFDGGNGSTNAIYVDNLYFYKGEFVGIDEFDHTEFNVYPNPTNDVWNIQSIEKMELVQVFDLQGKQVLTLTANSETVSINASGLTNGVYFVRVSSATGTKSVKLIKQ
ncbi:MAG: T9SS type A sorting domain-containing protein [Bacteroidia bacterium]